MQAALPHFEHCHPRLLHLRLESQDGLVREPDVLDSNLMDGILIVMLYSLGSIVD